MNNNRLGCLSPTAILSAIITLLIVLGVAFFSGNGMFSAGSLNAQAGAALGGITSHAEIGADCARCHPAFWSRDHLADRCLACHTNIKDELAAADALHGILRGDQTALNCRTCHPEHRGPSAPLTELNLKSFPHEQLGFALNTHLKKADGSSLICTDCHTNGEYHEFSAAACNACHAQMDNAFMLSHALGFGDDCRACHDGLETYGKKFDHTKTTFALNGKHLNLICTKCHLGAHDLNDLKTTPHDCTACHLKDDAHQGHFGTACGVCHNPSAWKPARFDHNLAKFKLTGKHGAAKCEACHQNDVYQGTPSDCGACHQKDDNHQGRFGLNCGLCHSTAGWEPATFDHQLAKFALTGAHLNLACEQCHINGQYQGTVATCTGCHGEPIFHAGLFRGQSCEACHNTSAWLPASYTGPHPTFGDKGGIDHEGATCRDCHTVNLSTATCLKCHDSNSPGDEGKGGGD